MDGGTSASIINASYINIYNFLMKKNYTNQWSTMVGSNSTSCEAKIEKTTGS